MLLHGRGTDVQTHLSSTVTRLIAAYRSQLSVASEQEYLPRSSMCLLLQLLHLSLMVREKYFQGLHETSRRCAVHKNI